MRRSIALSLAALVASLPAVAEGPAQTIEVQGVCQDGQLRGLRLFVPVPGTVTIQIPAGVCQAAPVRRPGNWQT